MATRNARSSGKPRKGTLGRVAAAAAAQKGKIQWVKWDDGDVIVLRVLDAGKDFKDAYVHRVPMEKDDGETFYADVPCLDQDNKGVPCPGCADEVDRRYKFWCNVIVRDWEDESGETKDAIMVWSGGITVAKRLDKLDARFGGLDKRDIEVEREGKKMKDTKYEIEPATDENEPLSDEDKALGEKRHDLTRYTKPPEFDDFYVPISEREKDDEDPGAKSTRRGSAFKRRQKNEDEEDDGERRTSSRRRSSSSKAKPQLKSFGGSNKSSGSSSKSSNVRRRRSR